MEAAYFLSPVDREVLAVLERGPLYGYLIIEALRSRGGGSFDLPLGGLYPILRRLERLGYVRSAWMTVDSRRRRTYALTGAGARERLE
ncbi:PadR family transcriptional regulator [Streptosporangium sp. CA-135522]|uniref:PadR family transcriptional regulator n=1 Tax=Streptosporangium sp. CA-135522 TaxID=3240072 RepID=UPI003D8B7F03